MYMACIWICVYTAMVYSCMYMGMYVWLYGMYIWYACMVYVYSNGICMCIAYVRMAMVHVCVYAYAYSYVACACVCSNGVRHMDVHNVVHMWIDRTNVDKLWITAYCCGYLRTAVGHAA